MTNKSKYLLPKPPEPTEPVEPEKAEPTVAEVLSGERRVTLAL